MTDGVDSVLADLYSDHLDGNHPPSCSVHEKRERESMTIKAEEFKRKEIRVKGLQVTEDNMEEVAEWCQGEIQKTTNGAPYIHVRVSYPRTAKQSKAFVTDWILYSPTGYKIYTDRGFKKAFDPA